VQLSHFGAAMTRSCDKETRNMRLNILIASMFVFGVATSGCDLLKRGQDKKDETQTSSSSTTSGASSSTATTAAEGTQEQPGAKKPATSGCSLPDDSTIDHDITITHGCTLVSKRSYDIREGATMTIEEGVKISWDTDTYLWVRYGKLIIKGTDAQPVTSLHVQSAPSMLA